MSASERMRVAEEDADRLFGALAQSVHLYDRTVWRDALLGHYDALESRESVSALEGER